MSTVPPFDWSQVALKSDLAALEAKMATKTDLAELEVRLQRAFTHVLLLSQGVMFAALSLVITLVMVLS